MIARALAKHLPTLGLGLVWDPSPAGNPNVFLNSMPAGPDEVVGVFAAPGMPQLTLDPSDLPSVQLRIRGAKKATTGGYDLARQLYSALTCMDGVWLDEGGPDQVWVIGCTAAQTEPIPLGPDSNGRLEWTLNFDLRTHAPTIHRPAIA